VAADISRPADNQYDHVEALSRHVLRMTTASPGGM
jgi:hypothetical protein